MKNRRFLFLATALAALTAGCDKLFYVPLTVTSFSPDREIYVPGDTPPVWIEFSAAVDPGQAEEAFSLSRDTVQLDGRFSWSGDRMTFVPYEPFQTGCQYVLKVDTSAEDLSGNSLEREFLFRFRFGDDLTRPTVVDAYPATTKADCDPYDHEVLGALLPDDLYHPLTFVFSEPVDQGSFYSAFSVSPDIDGLFSWPAADTVVFTPGEPYQWQTEYTVTLSTELTDLTGNALADTFTSHFMIGTENDPPEPVAAAAVIPNPARLGETDASLTENTVVGGWEADWNMQIDFNEAVDPMALEKNIIFTPAWDFTVTIDPGQPERVTLKRATPAGVFHYGETYTMTLQAGIADAQGNETTHGYSYLFRVNGPFTRPPEVTGAYYLPDVNAAAPVWEHLNPMTEITMPNTYDEANGPEDYDICLLDFYFTIAERTELPVTSFFEHFTVEVTNGCIRPAEYVVIDSYRYGETIEGPAPALPLQPGQALVRLYARLVNTVTTGSLTLRLRAGCADQSLDNPLLHNVMPADWSVRLIDPDTP